MTDSKTYPAAVREETVPRWGMFLWMGRGPAEGNPYLDVTVTATFRCRSRTVQVSGYYDGDGSFGVRFMPDSLGEWHYTIHSSAPELDGQRGSFACGDPGPDNHGPVRVADRYHFAYTDGTPYIPFGTTSYGWIHQDEELQERTVSTLAASPFNKLRFCVFLNDYEDYEPERFPFPGNRKDGFDLSRFDSIFFGNLDRRLQQLQALGIEADVILFHPYDKGRWGFDQLDVETEERYLRYVMARLGAYRHVWWSLANEYDFMKHKQMEDWHRLFGIVAAEDPYHRLRSIHNGTKMHDHRSVVMYDHTKPWITHCSIQHWDVTLATVWREQYGKPVIIDECCYEGNMDRRWGNLTGEEMVRRFWDGVTRGAYVSHAESLLTDQDVLWLAKGGSLLGESPARIGYLRRLMEEAPEGCVPLPIRDVPTIGVEGEYYLQYYGLHQPLYRMVELPEHGRYTVEVIDTWEMKVHSRQSGISGTVRIDLPGKLYVAVRMIKEKENNV